MSSPMITMSLADYDEVQKAKQAAEHDAAIARSQLEAERMTSPDGRVEKMTIFSRDCLTLAQFAIANCPPETCVGWPTTALRDVADGLQHLPNFSIADRDMAVDLLHFAAECEKYERARAGRRADAPVTVHAIEAP